jgi:eukaryotic-like serine/threonine-protein kinase
VQREIGRGGAAVVFLAHDHKHDRPVAVKILHSEVAEQIGAERFLHEIGMAAQLQHPHILPIYDSGDVDSLLYLIMPFVEGDTLRSRLAQHGPLTVAHALRPTLEVAEALSFAHSRGIVHRDVKPENVLLFRGHAMVADFGVAVRLTGRAAPGSAAAPLMDVAGTPTYMAPEQLLGDEEVDERADVYALATMLHELITGTPPFEGATAMAMLAQKMAGTPARLHSPHEAIPAHLVAAVERGLAARPDERFPSVAEFADALAALTSAPFPVRRAGASPARAVAVLPFEAQGAAEETEFVADGITDALIHDLTRLDSVRVIGRGSVFAFKGRVHDVQSIGAQLGVRTLVTGRVQRAGDRLRVTAELVDATTGQASWSERFDGTMRDIFEVQDEIASAIAQSLKVHVRHDAPATAAAVPDITAYEAYLRGRFDWNMRNASALERALGHMRDAVAIDPSFALGWVGLAECWITTAVYEVRAPRDAMASARAAADRALALVPDLPEALTARASIRALHDYDWAAAESDYVEAIRLREGHAGTHQWYALHLLAPQGRMLEARARVARARELEPLSPAIATSAAILRVYEGEYAQAVHELSLVLERHPAFGLAHLFLGRARTELGDSEGAVAALEHAVMLTGASAESVSALACAEARRGRTDVARSHLRALEARRATGYLSALALAEVHLALGDTAAAIESLQQAAADHATSLPYLAWRPSLAALRDHPDVRAMLAAMHLDR